MLTLDNFETQISPAILQRGKSYFKNGQVLSLEETNADTWLAEVEGSDMYSVEVTLKNSNEITDFFCDCPYDDGTCKHAASVFFALRNEVDKKKNSPKNTRKKDVFESLLQGISLTEVQDFIRSYSVKNKNFKTEFELFFADKDSRIDVEKKYTDLVNKLIKKHSDRGFIDYRASSVLAREIDKLIATGSNYLISHNYKNGFHLAKAVLKPMMEAITEADDSNGSLGGSISEAITLLENIADSDAAIDMKEQLFKFLETELNDKIYFDYGDFGYEMFNIFQSLAVMLQNNDSFLQFVDAQLAKRTGEYENYRKEFFKKKKIEFLQATGFVKEAETLTQQSLDIVEVRAEEVNKAIQKKDYATAKQLIADGIKIAEKKAHLGTVDEWKRALLNIAGHEKDMASVRQYAKYFAFDNGFSPEYYRQWKETFTSSDWNAVFENLIEELKQKTIAEWKKERYGKPSQPEFLYYLAPVYMHEKMWDRLLPLVQQQTRIDTVLTFHKYLSKVYPKEMLALYLPMLKAAAMQADTRSQYVDLVKKMQLIIKDIPLGKEKILALAQEIKEHFSVKPRRPAMIEELNKILQANSL